MSDPYAADVVLALAFNGSDGSTTLVDSSDRAHTVTAVGSAAISASGRDSRTCLSLNGPGNYNQSNRVSVSGNISDFAFAGDFTVECWLHAFGFGATWGSFIFDTRNSSASAGSGCALSYGWGNIGNVISFNGTSASLSSDAAPVTGTWIHIAVVRSASTVKMYVNGVAQVATLTDAATYPADKLLLGSSGNYAGTTGISGYLSDFRVTRAARYTANFTPPARITDALGADGVLCATTYTFFPGNPIINRLVYAGYKYGADKTTWSFSCDDPVGSTWTTEDTGNPLFGNEGAMYLTYGTTYSSSIKKFGDTSLFFPGGAYLTLPSGAFTVAAFTDFTFECWINVAASYAPQPAALIYGGGLNVGADPTVMIAGNVFLNRIGQSPTIALGTWHHYAVCRKANIIRHYLNGNKFAEALSTGALNVTQLGHGHGPTAYYLDSIGFSNNYAHYDANDFQPSLTPFYFPPSSSGALMQVSCTFIPGEATGTRITPTEADTQWNKTVLLLGGGGNVGSKVIADAKGRTVYNQSDVVYSDAHKKFAQTSLYFNGASKVVIPPARNLDFIDGDFTIDFWIYPTRIQASAIYAKWSGSVTRSYILALDADGKISFTFRHATQNANTTVTSLGAIPVNEFTFVSVCKNGNDYRVWTGGAGGTVVTTTHTPYRYLSRSAGGTASWDMEVVLGASGADGTEPDAYFQGYIEDFRVTNGFARYTDELYSPPTTGFLKAGSGGEGDPYWNDVKLLVHFDEPNGTVLNIREAKGHALQLVGDGYVNSEGLYGGCFYTGNSQFSRLQFAYDSDIDLSSGDFTLEVWSAGNPANGVIAGNSYGQNSRGWVIHAKSEPTDPTDERVGGLVQWTQWDSNGVQDIAIGPLFSFFWDHQGYGAGKKERWQLICVQRRGNDITIFVDGVGATTTITRRPAQITSDVFFGTYPAHPSRGFTFYDELRLTKAARYVGNTMPIPTGKYPEHAFSFGAAVLSSYYALIPGQVKAASVVSGATIPTGYSVTPPLIIGKPTAEGPVISHGLSILAADATGGEGFPEDFSFAVTLNTAQAHSHAQVFYVNDVAIAQGTKGVTARLGVTGVASAVLNSFKITETLALTGSVPGVAHAILSPTEALTLSSTMSAVWGVVLRATVAIADEAQRLMHQTVLDDFSLTTPATGTRQALSLTDALVTSDTAAPAWHRGADDTLGLGTTAASLAKLRASVTDTTAFDGAPTLDLTLYVTVSEDVALDDVPAQTLLFQAIVQDDVRFKAFFASPAYTAWAMNTRNAAVTQYTGFNFNSFAKMGERYLGANDQGLYWLDGDDDDGRTVKSRITTGIIQPNGNKLAGVQYAYLGMRGDGQFVVTVTDEAGGAYNYTLTGSSMETARVAFGRGLKTRYFTFSLESQGQDFDLDSVEFVTTEMARKVQR